MAKAKSYGEVEAVPAAPELVEQPAPGEAPAPIPTAPDSDLDGVEDALDACPGVADSGLDTDVDGARQYGGHVSNGLHRERGHGR